MSLNFPSNPTTGTQYASTSGVTYIYDGIKWIGHASTLLPGTNSISNVGYVVQVTNTGSVMVPVGSSIIDENGDPVYGPMGYTGSQGNLDTSNLLDVIPVEDNTYNLGSPVKQWKHLFVSSGSIYLGNIKLSSNDGEFLIQNVDYTVNTATNTIDTETVIESYSGDGTKYKDWIITNGGQTPYQMSKSETGYVVQLWNGDIILPDETKSGDRIIFTCQGSRPQQISVGSNSGMIYHGDLFDSNKLMLYPGETVELVSRGDDGGTEWDIVGGSVITRLAAISTSGFGNNVGTFTTLPDFLEFTPGTILRTGQTADGVFFSGNAGDPYRSYPIRSVFAIPGTTKVTVTVETIVNDYCSDFGLCVFQIDKDPQWEWDPNPTRIAAQYDCRSPVINGTTSSHYAAWALPGNGIYKVRFTYDPVNEPNLKLETIDPTSDTVLDSFTVNEKLDTTQYYRIGFAADQDDDKLRTYVRNLIIDVNGGSTYSDSLTLKAAPIATFNYETPLSSTATGTTGNIVYDTNYVYICVTTNTWIRAALDSGW